MTHKIKVGHLISKISNDTDKYKVYMISQSYLGIIYHLININDKTPLNINNDELVNWKREEI